MLDFKRITNSIIIKKRYSTNFGVEYGVYQDGILLNSFRYAKDAVRCKEFLLLKKVGLIRKV